MRRLTVLLAALAVVASACSYESVGTTTTLPPEATEETPSTGPAEITFTDQRSEGSSVVVESVTVPDAGFVVLQADDAGTPGDLLGISERLNAGITVSVPIAFLVPIEDDTVVHATVHIDMDRDGVFRYEPPDDFVDLPAVQANGEPAATTALVELLPPIAPGGVAFDEQRSDGISLVVGGVTLPAPGFVAVQRNEGGEPGTVLGSTGLLDAGQASDLLVELDTPLRTTGLVFVVAYVDRDEDGVLTVGEDAVDQFAVSADGQPAVDSQVVTVIPLGPVSLTVEDQELPPPPEDEDEEPEPTTVVIAEVSLPSAGFVELRIDVDGAPGEVLVVSDLLPEGTTTDLALELDETLTEETTFWVTTRIDFDEDGERSADDPRGVDEEGANVRASFTVTPPEEDDGDA